MPKSVPESYSQLWHYTTAEGLYGILRSQQLWATNIFYLNDAEEFSGFFDRKLLEILKNGASAGIAEAHKTPAGLKIIEMAGGVEKAVVEFSENLLSSIKTVTLNHQVYVTSFCVTSPENERDGLLSQWRGYGVDGGYAIVFDSLELEKLLKDEEGRFFFSFGHWGNADYFDDGNVSPIHEETLVWESTIQRTIAGMFIHQNFERASEELFEPIISLATRHKHRGFREEAEVRFAVVLPDDELLGGMRKIDANRAKKPVHFADRSGVLVPYIALFERPASEAVKLPIKKIIVGPHPEKLKRQKAIRILLSQLKIEAEVVSSDIPYLGR